ncbi:hypothetical protein [Streptomyces sp. NPDC048637]|uniref:hypothetical protein n=1 Tax=Streptomyces sp. NPDC048637 TaxID=3155636 RepID=UPI0034245F3F
MISYRKQVTTMTVHLLRRRCTARLNAVLAVLVAALGLVVSPLATGAAQADEKPREITVLMQAADQGNGQLAFARYVPERCVVTASLCNPVFAYNNLDGRTPTGNTGTWGDTTDVGFSMLVNADGSFHLRHDSSGICVNADSSTGGISDAGDCSSATNYTLQPASDGGGAYLIRGPGNKCLAPTNAVKWGEDVSFSECVGDDVTKQWKLHTADDAAPPIPSNASAIALGENKITVCNWGGYSARATIDYEIMTDPNSDTPKKEHRAISSFPVTQCRTEMLPAGKISATVTLRRFTWEKANDYKFDDVAGNTFAGSGANDRVTSVWVIGGTHANASFHMQGAACDSYSQFKQDPDSQLFIKESSGQEKCRTDATAGHWFAEGVKTAWGIFTKIITSFAGR